MTWTHQAALGIGNCGHGRRKVLLLTLSLALAELEDEVTVVERIEINGRPVRKDIRLTKGDTIRIEVEARDSCTFLGYYQCAANRPAAPWRRNEILNAFMRVPSNVRLHPSAA